MRAIRTLALTTGTHSMAAHRPLLAVNLTAGPLTADLARR